MSAPSSPHPRQYTPNNIRRPKEIHFQLLAEIPIANLFHSTHKCCPSVYIIPQGHWGDTFTGGVDNNINPAEPFLRLCNRALTKPNLPDITLDQSTRFRKLQTQRLQSDSATHQAREIGGGVHLNQRDVFLEHKRRRNDLYQVRPERSSDQVTIHSL